MARPYQSYQRIEISTSDPVRIVVLLYEGAIRNLNQTRQLLGKNNEAASMRIQRALDIINYLRNALDHEKGGEIAANLKRLYEYMRDAVSEANVRCDKEKIEEVISLCWTLLEGWRSITGAQTEAESLGANGEIDTRGYTDQPIKLSLVG